MTRPGQPPGLRALACVAWRFLAALAALAACHGRAAEPHAPARPDPAPALRAQAPAEAAQDGAAAPAAMPARLVIAVAELAGDVGQRVVKERVLAHLRARVPGVATEPTPGMRPGLAVEILDVPEDVLASAGEAGDDSPFALLQQGHERARALLEELRASALIWGTAGDRPVLYVTTAESIDGPCAAPAADAGRPREALCALETGATWLLCATAWADLVPVGCAP